MTNKQQKITHPQPQKRPKTSQLTRLKLEQLEGVAGGPHVPVCSKCVLDLLRNKI